MFLNLPSLSKKMHLQVFGAKKSYNFIVLGTFCQIKGYFYNQQETKGFFSNTFYKKIHLIIVYECTFAAC